MLVKAKNMPLYQNVKDHILTLIKSGEWPIDKRLPSERDLADQLAVSRMTANRALREIATEGYIKRLTGVGSFVTDTAEKKAQSHPLEIQNIEADIQERGHTYSCKVNTFTEVRAEAEIAMSFGISLGSRLFYSEIIHYESGMPIQMEKRHVLPSFAPDYLKTDFTKISTGKYLMNINGSIEEIEQIVQACIPEPQQQECLGLSSNEPCLLLLRRTWVKGIVVTATKLHHPASRYQFGSRYKP